MATKDSYENFIKNIEDIQWLQRLTNIFNVVKHAIFALAMLLAAAILLIIGNTIRLTLPIAAYTIIGSLLLGLIGSWVAVKRSLKSP